MGPPLGGSGAVARPVNSSGSRSPRRALGLALTVLGVILLLTGWVRLRDAEILADQVSYLVSSGIGGVALIMTGVTLVASAGTREEVQGRLSRIESTIRDSRGN
jgi:drug/metabolite transporter (DMT)-like permease